MTHDNTRKSVTPPAGGDPARAAVVGAGPAGARAAFRLAAAGWSVLLIDHRYPWEKPCGGGLNERALALLRQTMPDFPEAVTGRRVQLDAAGGSRLQMELDTSFAVVPRARLQRMMVERAVEAGATLVTRKFSGAQRDGARGPWVIRTDSGTCVAEFLIGADGALSPVRQAVAGPDAWQDVRPALGMVHVFTSPAPGPGGMRLVFTGDPPGYIWEFPGEAFSTVGISLPFDPRGAVKAREVLHHHLVSRGWVGEGAGSSVPPLRGAMAPSAGAAHWQRGRIQGDGWALLGDAAGMVDPLTGEGIYYAVRSADMLAEALLNGVVDRYTEGVRREIGRELALAARYVRSFFRDGFPDQMLTLAGKHHGIRTVLGDLVSGRQPYLGLKQALFRRCVPAALRYLTLKLTRRW
jgi:geranylgeranyl reductase family protein